MGNICDADSYYPNTFKVLKIFDWPECTDVSSACAFIGVYVYYWIWIRNFAQIAALIYYRMRKNTPFLWSEKQVEAMDLFKLALTTPPTLVSLDYSEGAGDIILTLDASLEGWGEVLIQLI